MYVYMYARIQVCVYIHLHMHTHIHTRVHVYAHTHMHVCMRTYTCVYMYTQAGAQCTESHQLGLIQVYSIVDSNTMASNECDFPNYQITFGKFSAFW